MPEDKILEFGIKRENEERRDGGCAVVFYPETQKFAVYRNLKNNLLGLFGGGFNEGEDEKEGVLREVAEESGLTDFLHIEKIAKVFVHYRNINKNKNSVAFSVCFLVVLKNDNLIQTKLEEHENFELVWITAPELFEYWNSINNEHDYDHWIFFLEKSIKRITEFGYTF